MDFIDKVLLPMLIGEEGVLGSLGLVLAVALLILLRVLIPQERRRQLRFPFVCLGLHIITLVLHKLMSNFSWADELEEALHVISIFMLLLVLGRAGFIFLLEVLLPTTLTKPVSRITKDILQGLIYAGIVALTLRAAGVNLSSLLVTSALLTAVIGLALQETLGNLVAGLTLQTQQPFHVGDWIQIEGQHQIGEVIEINWRETRIITLDRVEVIIPNGMLAKNSIMNYSKPTRTVRRNIYVVVPNNIPPRKVSEIILKSLANTPDILSEPAPSVVTNKFLENGLIEYWVRVFIESFDRRDGLDSRVRDRIWYALERAKIEYALPASTINLRQLPTIELNGDHDDEIDQVEEYLRTIHFLAPVKGGDLHRLALMLEKRIYSPSERIINQGEKGNEFFIIHKGEVSVTVEDQEVSRMHSGSYFGEMSLLTGAARSATVTAVGEVELFVMSHEALREVLQKHPDLCEEMSRTLAKRQIELTQIKEALEAEEDEAALAAHTGQLLSKIKEFFSL